MPALRANAEGIALPGLGLALAWAWCSPPEDPEEAELVGQVQASVESWGVWKLSGWFPHR